MFKFNPFKSMTIQGTVATVAPYIVGAFDPSALSPTASAIVQGVGILWAAFGLRNAVEKAAGKAVADLTEKVISKR